MTLIFNIEYRTSWGEEVRVLGSIPELGNNQPNKATPLHTVDGIHWTAEVDIQIPGNGSVEYSYHIYRDGRTIRTEWNSLPRILHVADNPKKVYRIEDCWKNLPEQQYFYTSAFTESLLAHRERSAAPKSYKKGLLIKAYAPCIDSDHCLALCGNQKALGDWNPDKAALMSDIDFPEWQVEVDAGKISFPLEYKFVLYNKKERRAVAWENNPNRYMADPQIAANETLAVGDRYVYFNLPAWKGSGVAVPVFSLRSEKSFGVGDFGDLKRMIDWAVATNQKAVQILPINDTTMTHTWTDSYPYSSISIYAFHPMYADLKQLGSLKDKKVMAEFNKRQKELNALPAVDYEAVNKTKWEYFHLIFKQEGEKVLASDAFRNFYEANKEWLQPYAVFSYLRDAYKTPNFREWPKYATYDAKEIETLCRPDSADYPHIAIYYYIQFNLHLQLLAATEHARANGVVLKGDIPIGISRNSVEAWVEPYYFNLDGQAGAPPDDFSVNGQNWGFPTYNWEVMLEDGCSWWVRRFRKMAEYFNAYRIDHVLGFFRIWEIPSDSVHGLLGHFSPSLPMSVEEIESYGLRFRKNYFTHPNISDWVLDKLFGERAEEVKAVYLDALGMDWYALKPEYDTQRKVEAAFAGKSSAEDAALREGLYALISNVLFIPDPKQPDKYHPRISARCDYLYQTLSEEEKRAFDALYEDYYYHRHNEFWYGQAMRKLPVLVEATQMLVCAEDLGMVPECVPWVMDDLRILTLEIQTMPKKFGLKFGRLEENPYRSVSTIFTHDMPTLRGWWEEDAVRAQQYFNEVLQKDGEAPASIPGWLCEEVVARHLYSPSMLCLISWQDWMSIDERLRYPDVDFERINVPSNPRNYWHYRMHLTIEELMGCDDLNRKIRMLITHSGRD